MTVVRFGDVVKEVKSKIDRNNNPYEYYIAGDHMDSEDLHLHRKGAFATDDVGPAFIREFLPGQILYGSRRTYLKKVAVADFGGVTANTTFVLETKNEEILRQRLIPFIMLSDAFTEWSISKSKGSTNPYVLFSDLADFEFKLPSLEVQDKLVNLLWAMDDTIVSYKKAIAKTDDLVKSQFIEMFGDIENNCKGYPVKQIEEFSDLFAGATPSTKVSAYWENGTIPWMSSGEVHMGRVTTTEKKISQLGFDKCSTKMVPLHTVVIALAGQGKTRGTVAVTEIELCTNQSLCAIVTDETVLSDYLYHNLRNRYEEIRNMCAVTDGRGGLNLKIVGGIKVIVPRIEEQRRFIAFAEQSDKSKFALKDTMKSVEAMMNKIVTDSFKISGEEV